MFIKVIISVQFLFYLKTYCGQFPVLVVDARHSSRLGVNKFGS